MQMGYKGAQYMETVSEKISRPNIYYWVEYEVMKKGLNLTKTKS